ncbi:MAG: ATP-binding protein [Pseudomonadota bacterium]
MGRLFWKIFLWFWLAMFLMILGITLVMSRFLQTREGGYPMRPPAMVAASQVMAVAAVLEHGGESATRSLLEELSAISPVEVLVFDDQGRELLGRSVANPGVWQAESPMGAEPRLVPRERFSANSAQLVDSREGNRYRVQAEFPAVAFGLAASFKRNSRLLFSRLGMAALVSGLVCFWLAWYLAGPVRRLREATRRFSEGELDVRVTKAIGKRRDEIADLGRDFDHMAGRLQALISSQRQLLNDVSHELRSPLARLQVAVGLARKKAGERAARELDRIEREVERLDDLVGEVLALARLEVRNTEVLEDDVNIADLLSAIVDDAEFEAANRNRYVHFTTEISPILKANAELLHRAVENVVRNAVRYTAESTTVQVTLHVAEAREGWIDISVCDSGPGVPEKQLSTLFEPFVRTTGARDRGSGGYGLGLAIAKRAIGLHGGTVSATNRKDNGLCVEIALPLKPG